MVGGSVWGRPQSQVQTWRLDPLQAREGRQGGAQTRPGLPAVFPALGQPGPALPSLLAPHLDLR